MVSSKVAPFFSVIFCVNKDNPFLEAAISSIISQSYVDFEFLISANNCDDSLFEKLQAIAATDGRIKLFRTKIGQLAFNLNFLANEAVGSYLVRMDADDYSEIDRFDVLRSNILHLFPDIIGSWATLIDTDDQVIGISKGAKSNKSSIRRRLLWRNPFCHPTVAIRRDFLLAMRGYSGGFVSEDYDLWLRAVRNNANMHIVPVPLFRYRIHPAQASRSRLGYAESVGYWLREFIVNPNLYYATGLVINLVKVFLAPLSKMRFS